MRLAKTVMTILCLPSTMSSGRAYTGAPIILAMVTAYWAFLIMMTRSEPGLVSTRDQSMTPGCRDSMRARMGTEVRID